MQCMSASFTCVRLMQVALQATCVGRLEGAELTLEGLVVPMVRLHMSVQAERRNIQNRREDMR